jgi:hypothetical protein
VKSDKNIGKNNARHEKFKDQHLAVGPNLAGALVPLLKWGERTGVSKGVLDTMRNDRGK